MGTYVRVDDRSYRAVPLEREEPLPAATLAALEALTEPQLSEAAKRLVAAQTLADVGL